MYKVVPQGSIIGHVLFNISINDIFQVIHHTKNNYADDNTILYSSPHFETMKHTLEAERCALVDWFAASQVEASPEKCQGIAVGKKAYALKPTFNIQGADIEYTDDVMLLDVTIYYPINFGKHISNLCKMAARQINVLRRIGKYLPINGRKVIYQAAFILSAFNFCPVIWHFCSEANTTKLEQLNYRALRHVYND